MDWIHQKNRSQCFRNLIKQKAEITYIHETHKTKGFIFVGTIEIRLDLYVIKHEIKKRGVTIYIKDNLESKLINQDVEGRWICVETKINEKKILIINVYTPNDVRESGGGGGDKQLEEVVSGLEYTLFVLLDDFNDIIDPELDK